jgi:hypothetical protein
MNHEWSRLIQASERTYWPSSEKQLFIKDGLLYLKEFFGDRVLKLARDSYHPYFTWAINTTPQNLQKYSEFGHKIKALKNIKSSGNSLKKLRKAAHTAAARSSIEGFFGFFNEVETAYSFVEKCLPIEFISESKSKTPDLKVYIDRKWLYIEITNFQNHASFWEAEKFKSNLRDKIIENFNSQPYHLHIGLWKLWDEIKDSPEETISLIIEELDSLFSKSKEQAQANIGGIVIDIYKWGGGLSMLPPRGPQWVVDYPKKIRSKIIDKAKQLKDYAPGIIVVSDRVYNFPDIYDNLELLNRAVQLELRDKPHVSAVMLVFDANSLKIKSWPKVNPKLFFSQYVLNHKTRLLTKFVVLNNWAKEPLSQKEVEVLLSYPKQFAD